MVPKKNHPKKIRVPISIPNFPKIPKITLRTARDHSKNTNSTHEEKNRPKILFGNFFFSKKNLRKPNLKNENFEISEKLRNFVNLFFDRNVFRRKIFRSKNVCYVFRSQVSQRFQKSYLENVLINGADTGHQNP